MKRLRFKDGIRECEFEKTLKNFEGAKLRLADKYKKILGYRGVGFEDILQELDVDFYSAYKTYNLDRGILFTTYCLTVMERHLLVTIRNLSRRGRYSDEVTIIHLESSLRGAEGNRTVEDSLGDYIDPLEDIEFNESLKSFNLTERQLKIAQLIVAGYKQREIAKVFNCSQVTVSRAKKGIAEKLREVI